MGSKITYVTCRTFQPKTVYFRALHHVTHQEAIGILDPFQRWADRACIVCGTCSSDVRDSNDVCGRMLCMDTVCGKVGE